MKFGKKLIASLLAYYSTPKESALGRLGHAAAIVFAMVLGLFLFICVLGLIETMFSPGVAAVVAVASLATLGLRGFLCMIAD